MDVFWAAPPVTRTLTAAAVATSVLVTTNLVSPYYVVWLPYTLLKFPPQIWRAITSFLVTAPGFGILMDSYFLYTYGNSLETQSARFANPGDFVTYLSFIWLLVLAVGTVFLNGFIFLPALTLALAYTNAQENPGGSVMFFVVTVPVRFLPYIMLVMTFAQGGPDAAMVQATGLFAAHLYDFLTRIWPTFGGGRNLLRTPAFVERAMGRLQLSAAPRPSAGGAPVTRSAGADFQGARPRDAGGASNSAAGSATGSDAGSNQWFVKGAGRRLGG